MTSAIDDAHDVSSRRISVPVFLAIVVIDLALIASLSFAGTSALGDFERGEHRTVEEVVLSLLLPVAVSAAFVFAVVTALGWWRPVLHEDRPAQRWVWIVPGVFLVAILLGTDYGALADKSVVFVALLLLAALCVGFSEEALFRGIGVTVFRANGFSEHRVALWTCVVFGAAHLANAVATGGAAFAQASRSASPATSST